MLGSREAIILHVLEELSRDVILIGGYAVNAYVPPRFSIDCDLVVLKGVAGIKKVLVKNGFEETERGEVPHGEYIRFVHKEEMVSFDLLVHAVLDRDSKVVFEGSLFTRYSRERITVGRANPIRISMKIADPELLFAMKFVSARRQDIRDIFMLSGIELNWGLIEELIKVKCDGELIKRKTTLIRAKIMGKSFRDGLHGAFGKIPDEIFDDCSSKLVKFLDGLT